MSTKDIKPYEKNPRINDNAVDAVANSIREFGFKQPIVVDKDNVIIAGHTRWKAAKKLKMKEVPVIVASDLTEEQAKAYRLADNKVGERSMWDFDLLDGELLDISLDMEQFGFIGEMPDFESPEQTQRKDMSDKIVSQYEVIIECKDETEQEAIYSKLQQEGYNCRVLIL
jgi:hypothetical protein